MAHQLLSSQCEYVAWRYGQLTVQDRLTALVDRLRSGAVLGDRMWIAELCLPINQHKRVVFSPATRTVADIPDFALKNFNGCHLLHFRSKGRVSCLGNDLLDSPRTL